MVEVIQRLLQLLVLVGLMVIIAKPAILPAPASSVAQAVHVWVVGPEDTWKSFQTTWQDRLYLVGKIFPTLKKVATTIPDDPPEITADGVLDLFNHLIVNQPLNKWSEIKQDLTLAPLEASPAAEVEVAE